jgi:tetratricopeptide (TPR) repeat protein
MISHEIVTPVKTGVQTPQRQRNALGGFLFDDHGQGLFSYMVSRRPKRRELKIGLPLVVMACAAVGLASCSWFADGHSLMNLWLTPDQQGRYYFEKGDYKDAAERFQDPLWKGIAYYRSGKFEAAAEQFARLDTPEGYFNLGDAYAHFGQWEQAVASYEEALRRKPDDKAAKENRDLVQSLIRKKKAKEKKEEPPEGQEPKYNPDEAKFDEKGKKGKKGEINQAELSAEQIQQVWMRRLQTTPSDFLRLKFEAEVEGAKISKSAGEPQGGK